MVGPIQSDGAEVQMWMSIRTLSGVVSRFQSGCRVFLLRYTRGLVTWCVKLVCSFLCCGQPKPTRRRSELWRIFSQKCVEERSSVLTLLYMQRHALATSAATTGSGDGSSDSDVDPSRVRNLGMDPDAPRPDLLAPRWRRSMQSLHSDVLQRIKNWPAVQPRYGRARPTTRVCYVLPSAR